MEHKLMACSLLSILALKVKGNDDDNNNN